MAVLPHARLTGLVLVRARARCGWPRRNFHVTTDHQVSLGSFGPEVRQSASFFRVGGHAGAGRRLSIIGELIGGQAGIHREARLAKRKAGSRSSSASMLTLTLLVTQTLWRGLGVE